MQVGKRGGCLKVRSPLLLHRREDAAVCKHRLKTRLDFKVEDLEYTL